MTSLRYSIRNIRRTKIVSTRAANIFLALLWSLLLLGSSSFAQAPGTIMTVAGGGPLSNVPATSVAIANPWGILVDANGNLYIAATEAHQVYKVDPGGNLVVIAGNGTAAFSGDNGPAINAQLSSPRAVAV